MIRRKFRLLVLLASVWLLGIGFYLYKATQENNDQKLRGAGGDLGNEGIQVIQGDIVIAHRSNDVEDGHIQRADDDFDVVGGERRIIQPPKPLPRRTFVGGRGDSIQMPVTKPGSANGFTGKKVPWQEFDEKGYVDKKRVQAGEDPYARNKFNQEASDNIPAKHHVPDTRHMLCKSKNWMHNLPDTSVIITFHNEARSTLLRTVVSLGRSGTGGD